jgi:glycosyltransferase 2 family protein
MFIKKILNKKKVINLAILLFVTITIFYLLFTKISLIKTIQLIQHSNMLYLLSSLLLLCFIVFLLILRWYIIITKFSSSITFKQSMISLLSSLPLNSFLPSKAGDLYKAYYFKHIGFSRVLGAVFTERIFDVFALIVLLLSSAIFLHNTLFTLIALSLLIILLVIFIFFRLWNKLPFFKNKNILNKLSSSFRFFIKDPLNSLLILAISIFSWGLSLLQLYLLFMALSIKIPLIYFFATITIVIFISMIPITVAGMGTRESAILYFFSSYGTNESLLAAGLLFSFFRYWLWAIIGLPFLIFSLKRVDDNLEDKNILKTNEIDVN